MPIPGLVAQLPTVTVDTIADVNDMVLRHLTDRSPQPLMARLRADVDKILAITADRRPDERLSWFDNDEPARERPITVEFRSAYSADITLVLHRGW
ncbi:hypothetical protein [Micromonospora sp. RTGN7]|uniref:hypothetical protein n=1 Tax=Micromonospora sp. RTGN7 TaxID=3016526 RepID=UPI0029FF2F89|nr:hypothetical protein [Micromonospora sp. RTGN7]